MDAESCFGLGDSDYSQDCPIALSCLGDDFHGDSNQLIVLKAQTGSCFFDKESLEEGYGFCRWARSGSFGTLDEYAVWMPRSSGFPLSMIC